MRVQRLIESMNNANVDVIVYPTWSDPPRLIGEYHSADGGTSLAVWLLGLQDNVHHNAPSKT